MSTINKKTLQFFRHLLASNLFIIILIFVVSFAILLPYLLAHHTFIVNLDNTDQFYAWYQKLAVDINHGFLPLWNTDTFSGQSFAGDLQAAVFYPVNIVWVWLFGSVNGISEMSINLLIITQFAIGAIGAYLLIKEFGTSRLAAFLGGLLFVFSGSVATRASGQMVVFIGFTLIAYPIYFLLRWHHKHQKISLFYAGLSLGIIILSGHVDSIYFAILAMLILEASLFFTSKLNKNNWPRSLFRVSSRLIAILGIASLIGLPQIFLSVQYLPNAYRWQLNGYTPSSEKVSFADYASVFILNPSDLSSLINPDTSIIQDGVALFIGLTPLMIIILALCLGLLRGSGIVWKAASRYVNWLLVIGFSTMFGYLTWFSVLLYKLPIISQIREPVRYAILVQIGVVILFSFAFDYICNTIKPFVKHRIFFILCSVFLIIDAVYVFAIHELRKNKIGFSKHQALQIALLSLALVIMVIIVNKKYRRFLLAITLILVLATNTLWFFPNKLNSSWNVNRYDAPLDLISILQKTDGQYRVDIEYGSMPVNSGIVYHFQTIGGYGATVYAPYYIMQQDNPYVTHLLQPVHESTKYYVPADEKLSTPMQLDILGVKYVVVNSPQYVAPGVLAYSNTISNLYLSERPTALSKIFTVLKSGSNKRSDYASLPTITNHYDDQYQSFTVTTTKRELVAISEIQYPGWRLTIDGTPATWKPYILGGVPMLRSFVLPSGTHKVEFKYQPIKIL